MDFIGIIRQAAEKKIIYTSHATDEMNNEFIPITTVEVRTVIFKGEVIEDYFEDKRGHSCLLSGETNKNRIIHVVCSPKDDYLAIITAYQPTLEKWESNFKTRRKK